MLLALHHHRSPSRVGIAAQAGAILEAVLSWPSRVARQRALLTSMARMSDYELADIGLSRHDVSDATAVPLGDDPSALLALRASERRVNALRR